MPNLARTLPMKLSLELPAISYGSRNLSVNQVPPKMELTVRWNQNSKLSLQVQPLYALHGVCLGTATVRYAVADNISL